MYTNFKHLSMIVASLVLIGCGGGGTSGDGTVSTATPTPTPAATPTPTSEVTDTEAPLIKSASAYTVNEDKKYISYIEATDTSEISYSLVGGVDKDKFSIDSHEGTLIFNDFPDYENPTDADSDGVYEVTVRATDSSNNTSDKDITVTLSDIDESQPKTYVTQALLDGANSYDVGTTAKDLYIVFSNADTTNSSSPSVSHNAKVVSAPQQRVSSVRDSSRPVALHAPVHIQNFNAEVNRLFKVNNGTEPQSKMISNSLKYSRDTEGSSQTIYLDENGDESTQTTVKKVVADVNTSFGNKTLTILVSDDSFQSEFGGSCTKSKCVTQEMVDALADSFLKVGNDNDIYDWVTNIFGEEWSGSAQREYSNLIGETNEITILLTDIDGDDSPTGGTIGYFWSKDNIAKSSLTGSNERTMFYVDSVMFANGEGEWDIDDFWPKELVATLAHEFQHMIHFYQKTVLMGTTDDTWINEMLSETTEDLIATKIRHSGPRGISPDDGSAGEAGNTDGRYPLFNENNTLSLTSWNNTLADYSKVNAFGTFLTRNYGGEKVLHDIMYNDKIHEDAVEFATGKSFADLLREWGVAVMLSDRTDAQRDQYSYNTGDFTVSQKDGVIYKMGAINFFNYDPTPMTSTDIGTVNAQGNYYYKVGTDITGTVDIDLSLNSTTTATLIVK